MVDAPGPSMALPADDAHELTWEEHQAWEKSWWDGARNTFGEQAKHLTYLHRMGVVNEPRDGKWPVYDLGGRSVIDIGGGPCSPLLQCVEAGWLTVCDPCDYPEWVGARYGAAGIELWPGPGEQLDAPWGGPDGMGTPKGWDEAWLMNCLQHTQDPAQIIRNARAFTRTLRIFEWIDTPPEPGHPHTLTEAKLNDWCGGTGTVEEMRGENGCYGRAYYGVFGATG